MKQAGMRLGLFGLGEAGGLIGADLAAAGLRVYAYDPRPVATPAGVTRCEDPAAAVADADAATLRRLVHGTHRHALRRLHEMEASTELLLALGVEPLMTRSTTQNLANILRDWPDPASREGAGALPAWWRCI